MSEANLVVEDESVDQTLSYQTGFDQVDITIVNMDMQDSAGVTGYRMTEGPGFDSADLSADPSGTAFYSYNQDALPWLDYVIQGLGTQAWHFIRVLRKGKFEIPHEDTVLGFYMKEFQRGLLSDTIQMIQNDASAATALSDILQGLNYDDDGVGTNDVHWQKLRRKAYKAGIRYRKHMPDLSQRIETIDEGIFNKNVAALVIAPALADVYEYPLGMGGSDKGWFNVAMMIEGFLKGKIKSAEFKLALEPVWKEVGRKNKVDILGSNIASHKQLTQDILDPGSINSASLDTIIDFFDKEFSVVDEALKTARVKYGIGKYESGEETVHFGVFLNGAVETSGGAYDTHGQSTWRLGLNTALLIDFLQDASSLKDDLEQAAKKDHYTWTGIIKIYSSILTPFSIYKGFEGRVEPQYYRAARSQLRFSDDPDSTTGFMNDVVSADVSDIQSANVFKFGTSGTSMLFEQGAAILPFVWNFIQDKWILYSGTRMTLPEFIAIFEYGIEFLSAKGTHAANVDFTASRIHLVEFINAVDTESVEGLMYATSDTYRFDHVKDVYSCTRNITHKYALTLVQKQPDFTSYPIYSASRLKGIKDKPPSRIPNFGTKGNALSILELIGGQVTVKGGNDKAPAQPPSGQDKETIEKNNLEEEDA
jgi:hypothetical protein